MGAVVVVDPWRWDNTRGDTRSFVDLLDGVHATTSNAHGPAAFSPRLRCRLAVAARNESAAWRLPLVRACALVLRVTRRGRVTRRPLLLDALENRLALLGVGGTGRVCAGIVSLFLSLFLVVSCHAAALSRRDTIFEGVVTGDTPRRNPGNFSSGWNEAAVLNVWKGGGGWPFAHLGTETLRFSWSIFFSSREGRNLKNERIEWWDAR